MFKVRKGAGAIGVKIDGYKQSNTRNKRIAILILVIILTILLWGAIRLSIQAKEARELHKQVVAILDPVQNDVYRAEGLVTSDPTTVATILFESKQKISQIENLTLSVDDAKQLADIKKKMQEIDDRISGRINVSEENNKLSRVIDGRTAYGDKTVFSDMVYYKDDTQNEYLFVTDRGNGAVYKILIDEKKAEKIEDKDKLLSSPMYVDYGNFGVYVYDSDSGMLKASLSNGKTGSFVELSGVGTDELQDSTITDLGIFTATDNIYLVDTKQGAVLKAVKTGSGYGLPSAYITDNAFSTGSDIFSDYSIYVLTLGSDGLHRYSFSNGAMREKPLSIVGLTEDFTDLTAGCTNGTLNDTLFVFDNGQKRILAFEKPKESGADILHPGEIHLLNQYVYRGSIDGVFSEVKEIAVNAKETEMYILDGNTIWKMQLGNE